MPAPEPPDEEATTPPPTPAGDDDTDARGGQPGPADPDRGAADGLDGADATADAPDNDAEPQPRSGARLALIIGVATVVALTGLGGWLGHRAYQFHHAQQQRNQFVQVGRQAAINLTTISFTEADADTQRIIDSATGPFRDDFQKRSPAFVEVVKQVQAKTEGTVTEAGLESDTNDQAKVLVAVTVKTSNAGAAEQQPRHWRMRITVQKVGDDAKVSQVEFIP